MAQQKLLVLTSGGDAPGMNAAIRGIVRIATYYGWEVFACEHGFQGLIQQQVFPLSADKVANRIQSGGTFLKTQRCLAFHEAPVQQQCRDFLQQQGFNALIVIGGNGSLCGAATLSSAQLQVIGIPASIDNDIPGTDYSIGFDTARNTALLAIDNIRDTASSHDRHFLIEVMGRESGFLAVDVGIACGAEHILTPEFPLDTQALAQQLQHPKREKLSCIIVVAEAGQPGRSIYIQHELQQLTGLTCRVCILGHIQRGGRPTALDRSKASRFAECAIDALRAGQTGQMTAWQQGKVCLNPLPNQQTPHRHLSDESLLHLSRMLAT